MKEQEKYFYTAPLEQKQLSPDTSRTMLGHNESLMMLKMDFAKGATGEIHHHVHTQATYVLSGSFEFTIAGTQKIVKQGDACFMPANVPHGCICLEAGSLLDVFTPERKDFLNQDQ